MRIILILVIAGTLAGFLDSCKRELEPGESVSDYFWPVREGKSFIYETTDGAKHTIRMIKVTRENDEKIIVETEEVREGPNMPEKCRIPSKAFYEMDLGREIVYRRPQAGLSRGA